MVLSLHWNDGIWQYLGLWDSTPCCSLVVEWHNPQQSLIWHLLHATQLRNNLRNEKLLNDFDKCDIIREISEKYLGKWWEICREILKWEPTTMTSLCTVLYYLWDTNNSFCIFEDELATFIQTVHSPFYLLQFVTWDSTVTCVTYSAHDNCVHMSPHSALKQKQLDLGLWLVTRHAKYKYTT